MQVCLLHYVQARTTTRGCAGQAGHLSAASSETHSTARTHPPPAPPFAAAARPPVRRPEAAPAARPSPLVPAMARRDGRNRRRCWPRSRAHQRWLSSRSGAPTARPAPPRSVLTARPAQWHAARVDAMAAWRSPAAAQVGATQRSCASATIGKRTPPTGTQPRWRKRPGRPQLWRAPAPPLPEPPQPLRRRKRQPAAIAQPGRGAAPMPRSCCSPAQRTRSTDSPTCAWVHGDGSALVHTLAAQNSTERL